MVTGNTGIKQERVIFKNGYDFYKNHDFVPIEEVAKMIGLDVIKNGYNAKICCPCPDHDDKNPSVDLNITGKYANTFKCWSCGEHGGPLELVMAAKYNIKPSKYWDIIKDRGDSKYTKKQYYEALKIKDDAAKLIDSFYPGAIEIKEYIDGVAVEDKEEDTDSPKKRPELPADIWKDLKDWLGADRYVGMQKMIPVWRNEKDRVYKIFDALPDYEYGMLMYTKLMELQDALKAYGNKILKDFPELDNTAKMAIKSSINKKIENIDFYVEAYRKFTIAYEDKYLQTEEPWLKSNDDTPVPMDKKEINSLIEEIDRHNNDSDEEFEAFYQEMLQRINQRNKATTEKSDDFDKE